MTIKLLTLKSQEDVIADVYDIILEEKTVGYHLKYPYVISLSKVSQVLTEEVNGDRLSVNYSPWNPLSSDEEFQIPADWVVTIAEPLEKLKSSYEEQLNAKERTMSVLEEQSVVTG